MIVARLELWPLGDPRAIESIALLTIANVGPVPGGRHRYHVRCGGAWATVLHRREDGTLVLLEKALRALRTSDGGCSPAAAGREPAPAAAPGGNSRRGDAAGAEEGADGLR